MLSEIFFQPDYGEDMIGRPARNKSSQDERDRLQRLLCPVLRLDHLLLLPPEPDHNGSVEDDDGEANEDEPDSLSNLVDQVWSLCSR